MSSTEDLPRKHPCISNHSVQGLGLQNQQPSKMTMRHDGKHEIPAQTDPVRISSKVLNMIILQDCVPPSKAKCGCGFFFPVLRNEPVGIEHLRIGTVLCSGSIDNLRLGDPRDWQNVANDSHTYEKDRHRLT